MQDQISRRNLLVLGGTGVAALGVSGCALFQQNANGSYGLSSAVITAIQGAVQTIANYAPAVESIAATAASLFGAQYSAIVTIGSTAVNEIITYLTNLVANPPTVGAARHRGGSMYARFGLPLPTGAFVGYTKNGVAVFSA